MTNEFLFNENVSNSKLYLIDIPIAINAALE